MSKDQLKTLLNSLQNDDPEIYDKASKLYKEINSLGKEIRKNTPAKHDQIRRSQYRKLQKELKTLKQKNSKIANFLMGYLEKCNYTLKESQYQFAPPKQSQTNTLDSIQSKKLHDCHC